MSLGRSSRTVSFFSSLFTEAHHTIATERVLLSTLLQQKHMIFFTKSKYLILTDTRIIQASQRSKHVRYINEYADLLGVTKSLRLGSSNFIMHFG